jgi:hypothetical protein
MAVPEGYRVFWYPEENFMGTEHILNASYTANGFLEYQSMSRVIMRSLKVERADATGFS